MMYALVHYPDIDTHSINQFRMKYDPQVELIAPHITLMFPVSESVGESRLIHHLAGVLGSWQSFPIHLQGLHIAPDDHLFLLLQEGNANVIRLHDEIYTGALAEYWRNDIPFIPHLTLGVLNKKSTDRDQALAEAEELAMKYRCVMDKLHLVKVNEDRSKILWSKEFALT